jgi:23S rRNA (adenine2030-N6)-methyltransferase
MNYRHAFHAGNHADVLKHIVLLAAVDLLKKKDSPLFALDTHAGAGRYDLSDAEANATAEWQGGIGRLWGVHGLPAAVQALCTAVARLNPDGALHRYPGSPWLLRDALRPQDRLAACELQPAQAALLREAIASDARVGVHARDGYGAVRALLPPQAKRGLVLIDPPYEAQEAEYPQVLAAVGEGLQRWPQAVVLVWYPIKQRRSLQGFLREAAALPAKGLLCAELLVRPDDSPLRLNGSGMLVFNPPWQLDTVLMPALPVLARLLGEHHASHRLDWLRAPP